MHKAQSIILILVFAIVFLYSVNLDPLRCLIMAFAVLAIFTVYILSKVSGFFLSLKYPYPKIFRCTCVLVLIGATTSFIYSLIS